MATPTTISQTLPAPILEGALTAFTKKIRTTYWSTNTNICLRSTNRG
jgi:hypothetical protein